MNQDDKDSTIYNVAVNHGEMYSIRTACKSRHKSTGPEAGAMVSGWV